MNHRFFQRSLITFGMLFVFLVLSMVNVGLSQAADQKPADSKAADQSCLQDILQKNGSISTENWARYKDEHFAYQLQFPARWALTIHNDNYNAQNKIWFSTLECSPSGIAYGGEGDIIVTIGAYNEVHTTLQQWFRRNAELTPAKQQKIVDAMAQEASDPANAIKLSDIHTSFTPTTVSGLDAILQINTFLKPPYIEGGAGTIRSYYVKKGSTVYELQAATVTSPQADALLEVFDAMVGTFKLL